ncbi:MAG: site-specific integrase [Syntrophorhabdales bacterium]|jgi:integrase
MTVKEAINLFQCHQRSNVKQRTMQSYAYPLQRFRIQYGERFLESFTPDELFTFLENLTQHHAKSTRRLRYAQIKAFFTFIIEKCGLDMKNPCHAPLLSKTFRMPRQVPRKILDREAVDEMVYGTNSTRDRLIIELQARCGLRIGELLRLRVADISERRLTIQELKSGKEAEIAFMPEQIANRLGEYVKGRNLRSDERLFPLCYSAARSLVRRLGGKLHTTVSPHDLRRYSATYASRNGVPLEIVSKVILRHHDLKTTQVYLGKVSEQEAIRWMDILHGK